MGTDLLLSQVNDFLNTLKMGKSGQTFIIESSGFLVATSTPYPPFTIKNNLPQRLEAIAFQDSKIRGTAIYLNQIFPDLKPIKEVTKLKFFLEGENHFLQVLPFQDQSGLDWLIVVRVPESDFMAQINANTRTTIALCFLALSVATLLRFYTSRWISYPILKLIQSSEAISQGDLNQQVPVGKIAELKILGQCHAVKIIQESGTHLLNLINDVLDLSKIEARKLELIPQEMHFSSFLLGVTEMFRIRGESKGILFESIIDPEIPEALTVDEKRLRQVLFAVRFKSPVNPAPGVIFSLK